MRKSFAIVIAIMMSITGTPAMASKILVPMDLTQTDHLKAYGLAYWCLQNGVDVEWLLNYRSGSFLLVDRPEVRQKATLMGVKFEPIGSTELNLIRQEIENSNKRIY